MTLVEVMAAMAILSILFVAISGLMINTVKSENRADSILEMSNYLKSALLLFDTKASNVESYEDEKIISFNNLGEMQNRINSVDTTSGGNFSIKIKSQLQANGLYKVTVYMKNRNIEETKTMIVSK